MNNINPLTVGFERAVIADATTFPRPEGDPCEFWKFHGITHVVYWAQGIPSDQLDGGNPEFYRETLRELKSPTCTSTLFDLNATGTPIIARVIK